jgi:hypothetical protein
MAPRRQPKSSKTVLQSAFVKKLLNEKDNNASNKSNNNNARNNLDLNDISEE